MKYRGAVHLVAPLAHAMADLWEPAGLPTDRAVLVPVPLAPDRLRERGYNQALLLSIAVADRVGLPVFDALRRVRRTRSQTALSLAGRVGNLEGAFAPGRGTPYLPVVLIDDVRTTGATLDACALALRAAGYSVTAGVTVFQTPDAAETPGDRGRRGR
jgi:predicted amidophosphoribosyltransferase